MSRSGKQQRKTNLAGPGPALKVVRAERLGFRVHPFSASFRPLLLLAIACAILYHCFQRLTEKTPQCQTPSTEMWFRPVLSISCSISTRCRPVCVACSELSTVCSKSDPVGFHRHCHLCRVQSPFCGVVRGFLGDARQSYIRGPGFRRWHQTPVPVSGFRRPFIGMAHAYGPVFLCTAPVCGAFLRIWEVCRRGLSALLGKQMAAAMRHQRSNRCTSARPWTLSWAKPNGVRKYCSPEEVTCEVYIYGV